MIAVLASPRARRSIRTAVGEDRCTMARGHHELRRLAADAEAVVVEAREAASVAEVLKGIKQQHPFVPIIVISGEEPTNVQTLASVSVEAVLFEREIMTCLASALQSAETTVGFRALGQQCLENEAVPVPLRRVLVCALTSAPPPRTVEGLAHIVYSDPSTLRRQWRRGVNSHGIERLRDLLDWLLLINAVSAKRPGLSWRLVARRMGTYESTLRRLAARLADDTLGSLHSLGAERLLERFAAALAESFCAEVL